MIRGLINRGLAFPKPHPSWSWNETHGRLSSRDSSMPGPWRGGVVPYLRHWHELATARKQGKRYMGDRDPWAHLTEQIWIVAGTQSAKTRSFLYASLGYLVDQHPSPKGLILPRKKDFKRVLDNRVRPFFTETPKLADHFPKGKQDQKIAITYEAWTLDTCTLYFLCGDIADDLRSWPICDLLFDEFDLLPIDCEKQGDPIELALDRQKTWPRTRLALGATTPTTVDGHGWRRLCSGSHERLLVECPACNGHQELDPDQLRWPEDATSDDIKTRDLARFDCRWCKASHDSPAKDAMVRQAAEADRWVPGKWEISADHPSGKWLPRAKFDAAGRLFDVEPAATTIRTGHFNSLYSPFVTLSDFAAHHVHAKTKGSAAEWQAHQNGWRCEPSIPQVVVASSTEEISAVVTLPYGRGVAPEGQRILLTLDQQGNTTDSCWFPWVARAFGAAGASWQIDCGEVHGWDELEMLCARGFTAAGERRAADVIAMDSANGNMRVAVQTWCSKEPSRRLLLRGSQVLESPWRKRGSDSRGKRMLRGVTQYYFDSTAFKNTLNDRLHGTKLAPPWFLPSDAPDYMLRSLTSEEQVPERKKIPGGGWRTIHVWQPRAMYNEVGMVVMRTDNHWWDCETMALVVSDIKGWKDLIEIPKPGTEPKPAPNPEWIGGDKEW